MNECVLTIDLGTTACKVFLFSPYGQVLSHATMSYPTWRPDAERAEQHPNDWWEATTNAVRKALMRVEKVNVVAISLSSQRETIVPVDSQFSPLYSALLWMDTRGTGQVQELAQKYGSQIQSWTGLRPDASYTAGKIMWFRDAHPQIFSKVRYFLQPKDYLLYRMSGQVATDYSLASRTLLYDIREFSWRAELLQACGISSEQFPEVHPPSSLIASLSSHAAAEWGLPAGIPIVLGGGDRPSEVLGSGIQSGEIMESSGTTSNLACPVHQPIEDLSSGILCSIHVVQGQWILEQGMSTSGAIYDWWRSLHANGDSTSDLNLEIENSPPGANGLVVLPFFMGSRAPRWNTSVRGAVLGLSLGHSSSDVSRAILEGIAYELKFAVENFVQAGIDVERIRLIGGGTFISSWNQIKANIYKSWTVMPKVVHAASFGSFLIAARELNWIGSYEEGQRLNPPDSIYHPDMRLNDLYDTGYRLYRHLYTQLEDTWGLFGEYRNVAKDLGMRR